MAHVFIVLAQSTIAEGDKLFPACLKHLRRLYPEVYSPAVSLGRAPARRDFHLGEDGTGLSKGTLIINSFRELGAYAVIFNNISPSIYPPGI